MSQIYITDRLTPGPIEREIIGPDLTEKISPEVRVLLVWHQDITAEYLDQFPGVHTLIRYGVGYDKIDLKACKERGITVCNTPDYCTEEVASTAITMILNSARQVPRYDSQARHYREGWQENVLPSVRRNSSLKVGFIGLGRIGSLTLKYAKALGFSTVFFDPYVTEGIEKVFATERASSLEDLLRLSDIVSLHCPSNAETQGMVDHAFVQKMKRGAHLVNTARGNLVSNLDVIEQGLRSEHLASAWLDVLPQEPPPPHSLLESWRQREEWLEGRLVLNPHSSFYSQESSAEQRIKVAENARLALQGKTPRSIVCQP